MLETERLYLRPFVYEDWQDLYEYLSIPSVVKYEPYEIYDIESAKKEAYYRAHSKSFYAICLKSTNKVIGNVYFEKQQPDEFMTYELGYVLNPTYQNQGYAYESCMEVLKYGFEELSMRRVVAMCNPENKSSWQLLERLKFRREGHLLQNIYFKLDNDNNPIWLDTYVYGMLKEEWDCK